MTPERIAELRADYDAHARDDDDTVILRVGLYRGLLAEAESAANLREAVERSLEMLHPASHSQLHEIRIVLRAAIDAAMKGGN